MKWTQEQVHEVAVITALISSNYFDLIYKKMGSSSIDTYDLIARWAIEFHNATYLFDWEKAMEEEEIEFSTLSDKCKLKGGCWDDFVAAYAKFKFDAL